MSRALTLVEALRASPDRLLAIVGPTASGKTDLAMEVASQIGGEVVSADSVQIYTRFDIGSGKPSEEERTRIPHHLVSTVEPLEPMDAARYASLGSSAIEAIRARGKVPVVCGGTFLWVKALLEGLFEGPPKSDSVRAAHAAMVRDEGAFALYQKLSHCDPVSAKRLHPNDVLRVSRALEVFELTGRTMASFQEEHAFQKVRYPFALFGLSVSSEALTHRIETRVRGFLRAGFVDEVRALRGEGYGGARAMASVGYREVNAFLDGRLGESDLFDEIVRATRRFARKQRTWLSHANVTWISL